MPKYSFLAKSLEGKTEKGILEAKDEFELAKILKERKLILVRAEKVKEKRKELQKVGEVFKPEHNTSPKKTQRNLKNQPKKGKNFQLSTPNLHTWKLPTFLQKLKKSSAKL